MAIFAGPEIVSSGLVLHLDAANYRSYPGSGTTWYDVSGNSNHGTLINGPVYSADNKGTMLFDGSNDYATLPLPNAASYNTVTIEGFIKWITVGGMFLGFTTYDVWTYNGHLGYNNGASNVVGISAASVTSLNLLGNYHHYAFVMNKSGLLSANKIYINGVSYPLTPQAANDGNAPGLTTTLTLASWNNTGFNGNVSYGNVRVYSRELTAAEIRQNFEAARNRYGI